MYIRPSTSINKLYAHALLHKFKGQLCHAVVESQVMGALAVVVDPTLALYKNTEEMYKTPYK